MARNLDPKCKQCRREGEKLFLKGERCFTPKCPIVKRNYPPGQHGLARHSRMSNFGLQLREKQKVKKMYRLLERQFENYFRSASTQRGNTAELFLQSLETRLDNVVYRLGLAVSRDQARQLIGHGHVLVNGKKVTIPSYAVNIGEVIKVKDASQKRILFQELAKAEGKQQKPPTWLDQNLKELAGTVKGMPAGQELEQGIQAQLIVEYYSR